MTKRSTEGAPGPGSNPLPPPGLAGAADDVGPGSRAHGPSPDLIGGTRLVALFVGTAVFHLHVPRDVDLHEAHAAYRVWLTDTYQPTRTPIGRVEPAFVAFQTFLDYLKLVHGVDEADVERFAVSPSPLTP